MALAAGGMKIYAGQPIAKSDPLHQLVSVKAALPMAISSRILSKRHEATVSAPGDALASEHSSTPCRRRPDFLRAIVDGMPDV